MDHRLVMVLWGPFRITDAEGRDLTPRGAKAQGLLALLATSPSKRRSRIWLQDKLWSDRGREQGAASLRQVLSEIRRALGPEAGALMTDRRAAALDARLVQVVPQGAGSGEFLEGIDLRDQEFEDWLRCQRLAEAPSTSRLPGPAGQTVRRPVIAFNCASAPGTFARLFEDLFVDVVSRSLSEALSVDVKIDDRQPGPSPLLCVALQAFDAEAGEVGLRARLTESDSAVVCWSGMRSVRARGGPPVEDAEILALGNHLIDALADLLLLRAKGRPERRDANILGRRAIRRIFSMEPEQLLEADRLLQGRWSTIRGRPGWLGGRS